MSEQLRVGLVNSGTTCFANVIIQALFMNDGLRQSILTAYEESGPVTRSLQRIFARLSIPSGRNVYPNELLTYFEDHFDPLLQHDCHEFLKQLLYTLRQERTTFLDYQFKSSVLQGKRVNQVTNYVSDIFSGENNITRTCLNCESTSIVQEEFEEMIVCINGGRSTSQTAQPGGRNIPEIVSVEDSGRHREEDLVLSALNAPRKPLGLDDLVRQSLLPQILAGDNQYDCDTCGLADAALDTSVVKSPQTLVVVLKRFDFDWARRSSGKTSKSVPIPVTLALPVRGRSPEPEGNDQASEYLAALRGHSEEGGSYSEIYGLTAITVHIGTCSQSGHYYLFSRHAIREVNETRVISARDFFKNGWFCVNDEEVIPVTYPEIQSSLSCKSHTPYIAMYQKVGFQTLQDTKLSPLDPLSSLDQPLDYKSLPLNPLTLANEPEPLESFPRSRRHLRLNGHCEKTEQDQLEKEASISRRDASFSFLYLFSALEFLAVLAVSSLRLVCSCGSRRTHSHLL